MSVTGREIYNVKVAFSVLKHREADVYKATILLGQRLLKLQEHNRFKTYKSPNGISYPIWRLFVQGVFGYNLRDVSRYINAAVQYQRLVDLKLTSVYQPMNTLWTARRFDDPTLTAIWHTVTQGDLTYVVTDSKFHLHADMDESIDARDIRQSRVTVRMIESEFIAFIDAINERITVTNGLTRDPEPTYAFDQVARKVVDTNGFRYSTSQYMSHITEYLHATNNL